MTRLKSRIHDASGLTLWVCYFPVRPGYQGCPHVNMTPFGNHCHSGASPLEIIGFSSFLQLTLLEPWYQSKTMGFAMSVVQWFLVTFTEKKSMHLSTQSDL